jgi:hypothetical protein
MKDQTRESLNELLRRFMDAPAAEAAHRDIQAGERLLEAWPAPTPDGETIACIKALMAEAAPRRHRHVRVFRGSLAAAAAIVIAVWLGLLGRGPGNGPVMTYASILPTAVWESPDLAADDPDLVYFTSQVRQIEAQMRALEAGESDTGAHQAVEELEMELMQIETEFWKG